MKLTQFHQLVGYWKVDCFVKVDEPFERAYSQKKHVPDGLQNTINRGEVVCLARMKQDPTILYASYCQAGKQNGHGFEDFFVVWSKKSEDVHIRGRYELRFRGSYQLVTKLKDYDNSSNIVWKSCRDLKGEPAHACNSMAAY